MTAKEIVAATGRSVTWLKARKCIWCGNDIYHALADGCGSIYGPPCDPTEIVKWTKEQ